MKKKSQLRPDTIAELLEKFDERLKDIDAISAWCQPLSTRVQCRLFRCIARLAILSKSGPVALSTMHQFVDPVIAEVKKSVEAIGKVTIRRGMC